MKFRVETWDTTQRCGSWCSDIQTSSGYDAWLLFARKCRAYRSTLTIRLSCKGWFGGWHVIAQDHGAWNGEIKTEGTKPMASRVVYDCGCASCGEDEYPCSVHKKETKGPMSTKQRGDVRHYPAEDADEVFRVYLDAKNGIDFDRQEFRRIWEAGNREFTEPDRQMGQDITNLRCELREKDAEIARLKAENVSREEERARLAAWVRRWMRQADTYARGAHNEAASALAGEKVPE